MVKSILDVLKVQLLLHEFDKSTDKTITYDWDGGHCYSSIECPIHDKLMDLDGEVSDELFGRIEDHCNTWLYENDDCPPCQIHVYKDGRVGSGCGCHDHLDPVQESEEIQDILIELSELEKNEGHKFLITVEE